MTARPLLVGAGAGLLIVLALAPGMGTALGGLARAREARATLARTHAALDRPVAPLAAPGAGIDAADAAAAQGWLVEQVRSLARSGGVLAEEVKPVDAGEGLAAVRLRLSGPEKAVVALADSLERGDTLLRFADWRVEPAGDGAVRLTGTIIGAWQ